MRLVKGLLIIFAGIGILAIFILIYLFALALMFGFVDVLTHIFAFIFL